MYPQLRCDYIHDSKGGEVGVENPKIRISTLPTATFIQRRWLSATERLEAVAKFEKWKLFLRSSYSWTVGFGRAWDVQDQTGDSLLQSNRDCDQTEPGDTSYLNWTAYELYVCAYYAWQVGSKIIQQYGGYSQRQGDISSSVNWRGLVG